MESDQVGEDWKKITALRENEIVEAEVKSKAEEDVGATEEVTGLAAIRTAPADFTEGSEAYWMALANASTRRTVSFGILPKTQTAVQRLVAQSALKDVELTEGEHQPLEVRRGLISASKDLPDLDGHGPGGGRHGGKTTTRVAEEGILRSRRAYRNSAGLHAGQGRSNKVRSEHVVMEIQQRSDSRVFRKHYCHAEEEQVRSALRYGSPPVLWGNEDSSHVEGGEVVPDPGLPCSPASGLKDGGEGQVEESSRGATTHKYASRNARSSEIKIGASDTELRPSDKRRRRKPRGLELQNS